MTRLLHTRSKIFFPNPRVVMIEYEPTVSTEDAERDLRSLIRRAYKTIEGTWGYTLTEWEMKREREPIDFPQLSPPGILSAIFAEDNSSALRAYACFKDELDELQFRLMVGARAIRVSMWPSSRLFTIHELVDES